jgi:exonuclease SbcC
MRPVRIEMEGFMAYRRKTELDLTDAELFVLSGPTGSGKSSAIDAMIFALYGSTPRFGKGRVEPVLNSSADWGRVLFEFTLGDSDFRVARRVERGRGVTEASLERDGTPLATGSREVGEKIPQVLGLDYEQFTRAVVLPQGAFARFLKDTSGQRQDLLRALLDLQLFVRVKEVANQRAKVAEAAAASATGRLAEMEPVTSETITDAATRLELLQQARETLPDLLLGLKEAESEVGAAEGSLAALTSRIAALRSVPIPKGLEDLAAMSHDAASALEESEITLKSAVAVKDEIEARIADMPDLTDLKSWGELHDRLQRLRAEMATLDMERLGAASTAAEKALAESGRLYQELHTANTAHSLRRGLAPGDPCPVCARKITEMPADADEGRVSLDEAERAMESARSTAEEARSAVKFAEGKAKGITDQIERTEADLEGAPDAGVTAQLLAEVTALASDRAQAEAQVNAAGAAREKAKRAVESVTAHGEKLRSELAAATARLEAEGSPEPDTDPVSGWQALDKWRSDLLAVVEAEHNASTETLTLKRETRAGLEKEFGEWMSGLGLGAEGDPAATVAVAVTRQEQRVAELAKTAETATALGEVVKSESAKAAVAAALGNHLKSNNFEEWVMEEAMESLVVGANDLLTSLSSDRYMLDFDDKGFEVVDRFNAGQRRSTDSLSGGETFLVSLALSLAMASQIAELAGSASRLESIFLDEGFDTLDPESLEVVGAVLDELVSQGRTVGIVTHVKEFAERIPTQFAVVNGPEGAIITPRET